MLSLSSLSETYQLVEEDETGKLTFLTPFHYQTQVESATSAVHNPARSRRLAQEISTLASSLPLSPSSSVFVRCDEERLDMMKVLSPTHSGKISCVLCHKLSHRGWTVALDKGLEIKNISCMKCNGIITMSRIKLGRTLV